MFIEHENLELDSENVEVTTEETNQQEEVITEPAPKTYTQDELNDIVGKRIARNTAKIRKEYERKYGDLEAVLRAGTGKEDVEEMTSTFRDFYQGKGIQMPNKPTYSDRDIEVLANAEADEIIKSGFEEVVEEVDRLAAKGSANMNPREKAVFKALAEYRQNTEKQRELAKIGVPADVYNSDRFRAFASKFSSSTPVTEIYSIYDKMTPKKEVQTAGSMKNGRDTKVKDYYTPEEIARLTEADLDNEEVWNAVRRSMTGK